MKSSNRRFFLFPLEGGGLGSAGTGWEAGSDQRPVTVGTSKGKGVEVYCFVERSLLSCWCVHSGVESPLIGLVAYCRAGPETHS